MPRPRTPVDDAEIRRLYTEDRLSMRAIAARFGCSDRVIRRRLADSAIPGRHTWTLPKDAKNLVTGPANLHEHHHRRLTTDARYRRRFRRKLQATYSAGTRKPLRAPIEYRRRNGDVCRLRGGFEVHFARWLDDNCLRWIYEPRSFLLSDGRRFTPDFWVDGWQTYVEVKGQRRQDTDDKLRMMASEFPDAPVRLMLRRDLQNLGIPIRLLHCRPPSVVRFDDHL